MSDVNNLLLVCKNIFYAHDRADGLMFEHYDLTQTCLVHIDLIESSSAADFLKRIRWTTWCATARSLLKKARS